MKIVQFLHGDELGGMEKFCIDLSNALSKEHEVILLGGKALSRYLDERVIFIEIDIDKSRNNLIFLWRLWKLLKGLSPDIIHTHRQKSIQIMRRLGMVLTIPFVSTKHDTQIKKAFYGLKYAIAISEETKKSIRAEHLFKIYNGIPYKNPKKIPLRKTFNIVAVGGLRKVKGYDKLIEAVSLLKFDYHLTIIGEGNERKRLEDLIDTLNLTDRVSLIGFKSNVNDYLYSADLQVVSSSSEGFSLAMVEGIFYSKVLISTKVSGSIEILSNELLINMNECSKTINLIEQNYREYEKEFNSIKEKYSEELTIDNCMKEHAKVFLEIINLEKCKVK